MVPCSRIAHIERSHKPYLPDLGIAMKRNAMRVAEIWMDEYKHNVNLAWNLPFEVPFKTWSRRAEDALLIAYCILHTSTSFNKTQ